MCRAAMSTSTNQRLVLSFLTVAATASTTVAMAQAPVPLGDWPYYSGDLAGTRFSPLTEIDTGNVGELGLAWSVPVARSATDDDDAPGPSGNPLATPIGRRRHHVSAGERA